MELSLEEIYAKGYLTNRELSWLKFNERVLEESQSTEHPLLERLKFSAIFSNNLDEFFMVRVAGLKEQVNAQIYERSDDGMTPIEQLKAIHETLLPLLVRQYQILEKDLFPKLRKEQIYFREVRSLKASQKHEIEAYFKESVFPILTPLAIDSSHPTPQLRALGLNLFVELSDENDTETQKRAFVPIPTSLPRFYIFQENAGYDIVSLEDIVEEFLEALFPRMGITSVSEFRITRNADLDISEDEADDLLKMIERGLRKRRLGTIIRLEVGQRMNESQIALLQAVFSLTDTDIYRLKGILGCNHFFQLLEPIARPDLKDEPFTPALHPQIQKANDIFEAIRQKDILLHHPYDSFNPVIDFLETAASDPNVLAIKQTLYRTTSKSPIITALKEAAENGKQVTALIELKARFDEEANITWARELEQAGVNVVYGMIGLKTHCKMSMVLRNENGKICPYVHLSTGNYNEKTALMYTDFGLFTADEEIGADVGELFNLLTGHSRQQNWRQIMVAPINMREQLQEYIRECVKYNTSEQPSRIRLVLNSLVDPKMIRELYLAAQKGVKIELIVRGICCLQTGVPGLSENIQVHSIVGRFLEHTRVNYFEFNGGQHIYTGSADWMPRNLNRRIEVLYPLVNEDMKLQVLHILDTLLKDNTKSWQLQTDGNYTKKVPLPDEEPFSAQAYLLRISKSKQKYIDTTASQNH